MGLWPPLLRNSRVINYNFIAIQEPWKNLHNRNIYCPCKAGFMLVLHQGDTRIVILVNNKFNSSE